MALRHYNSGAATRRLRGDSSSTCLHVLTISLLASLAYAQEEPSKEANATQPAVENHDAIPKGWIVNDICKMVPPYGANGRGVVLAWIIRNGGSSLIHECLFLKELDTGQWVVAVMNRNGDDSKWHVSTAYPSPVFEPKLWLPPPIEHYKIFLNRPSNRDIGEFVDASILPSFEIWPGFEVIGACVCQTAWKATIGEAPDRFFFKVKRPLGK